MNKEVIYLEPEDDITDILTKLQQAEQKLVALVPPKKTTILRSAVNMKLVARVAKECEKIVVIVTVDPAIVKMAMATRIPVAKSLNSRPVIPTEANVKAAEAIADADDLELDESSKSPKDSPELSDDSLEMPLEDAEESSKAASEKSADIISLTEDDAKKASKSPKKALQSDEKANFFTKNRKYFLIGIPVALVLILGLIWAFVFAPSASITVAISSTASNFSETVSFTTDPNAEDIAEGIFFAEEQSLEQKYSREFESNSKENKGEKAKGSIVASISFTPKDDEPFTHPISVGDVFTTADGLRFLATENAQLVWDGNNLPTGCKSIQSACNVKVDLMVEAEKSGEEYNISASETWNTFEGVVHVANPMGFSGGTTDMTRVVGEEDIDKLKQDILSEHTDEGKKMLLEDVTSDVVAITSSFKAEVVNVSSSPAVGDIVGENTTPRAEVTVSYTVYVVEKSKIDEYIRAHVTVSDDQKIYTISEPYFERYTAIEEPARLKAIVSVGPIVSEEAIFEKAKGRKTGEVQSQLRSISGVSSVEIRTSFFWVTSIPNNRDKVTITIEGEEAE